MMQYRIWLKIRCNACHVKPINHQIILQGLSYLWAMTRTDWTAEQIALWTLSHSRLPEVPQRTRGLVQLRPSAPRPPPPTKLKYGHVPHNNILVKCQPHLWCCSHKIILPSDILASSVCLSTLYDVLVPKLPNNQFLRKYPSLYASHHIPFQSQKAGLAILIKIENCIFPILPVSFFTYLSIYPCIYLSSICHLWA